MEKLMILDGNSIVNRAFYGIRLLTNSEGIYTNAVYGFLNILLKYLDEENPGYLCVAFDLPAPTFRHKQYAQYKAQRKGMPDELAGQLPLLKEVLSAMNIPMLSLEGYEADDIIGTVSRLCGEQGVECVILTGDKDDLQLASPHTRIKLITTRMGRTDTTDYTPETVRERYGVTPAEFIDVKGLMGDPSDNIPGVAGIGEKTALQLIQSYHSIEDIYRDLDELDIKPGVKKKLEEGRQQAALSKQLATIDQHAPIAFHLSDCVRREYDRERLVPLFTRLNFNVLLGRLNLEAPQQAVEAADDPTVFRQNLRQTGVLYYYLDGDQIAVATGEEDITLLPLSQALDYLADPSIQKIGHNIKEDMVRLHHQGVCLAPVRFDTMIAAYVVNASRSNYNIDELATEYLNLSMDDSAPGRLLAIIKLHPLLDEKITECEQQYLFYQVEMPLVTVLADMQIAGIGIDKKQLKEFGDMLQARIETLTGEIYGYAEREFNINSPKQLGEILFETLHLPVIKKTKSGYSTNVEVLEKLKGSHPIIDCIMEYRQLVKLKGTYADGLLAVINPDTGRVHSSFNQTVTVTGRISSTDPNMQNIPVRTELGREIRKMFVARDENHRFVDADYSQIELRVLAHIAKDETMIAAFRQGEDIHTHTAAQVFGVSEQEVTPQMRTSAKAVNFGIVYGIGEFSLAQDLGIRRSEAKQYIESYLDRFSGVRNYMTNTVTRAKIDGYSSTLLNRRRYLPELTSGNFITRAFGERVAMNTPIQGSAADIIKIAMVQVYKQLKEQGLKARLILQVHDELIVEAPLDEIDRVKQILKTGMEQAMELSVPLQADMGVGRTWYDAK